MESERRKIWDILTRPSQRETSDSDEEMGKARAFLDWQGMPYHQRFIAWLDAKIADPIAMDDQFTMATGVAKANAYKEIRQYLLELERRAHIALGE